jgi:hypothetical protein
MICLTTPAIVLRLLDGLNFSRFVRRPACRSSTSELPTSRPGLPDLKPLACEFQLQLAFAQLSRSKINFEGSEQD